MQIWVDADACLGRSPRDRESCSPDSVIPENRSDFRTAAWELAAWSLRVCRCAHACTAPEGSTTEDGEDAHGDHRGQGLSD